MGGSREHLSRESAPRQKVVPDTHHREDACDDPPAHGEGITIQCFARVYVCIWDYVDGDRSGILMWMWGGEESDAMLCGLYL